MTKSSNPSRSANWGWQNTLLLKCSLWRMKPCGDQNEIMSQLEVLCCEAHVPGGVRTLFITHYYTVSCNWLSICHENCYKPCFSVLLLYFHCFIHSVLSPPVLLPLRSSLLTAPPSIGLLGPSVFKVPSKQSPSKTWIYWAFMNCSEFSHFCKSSWILMLEIKLFLASCLDWIIMGHSD